MSNETENYKISRRGLLGGTAKMAGLAGIAGATGAAGIAAGSILAPTGAKAAAGSVEVLPGDLDEYYGFWSSGQAGEVRIMGVPPCAS